MTASENKKNADELQERDESIKSFPKEVGGPKEPEPTRYNDWERSGRVSDF